MRTKAEETHYRSKHEAQVLSKSGEATSIVREAYNKYYQQITDQMLQLLHIRTRKHPLSVLY